MPFTQAPVPAACIECHDLARHYVILRSDLNSLIKRGRARHVSRAERRRRLRLESEVQLAKTQLRHHHAAHRSEGSSA